MLISYLVFLKQGTPISHLDKSLCTPVRKSYTVVQVSKPDYPTEKTHNKTRFSMLIAVIKEFNKDQQQITHSCSKIV